MQKVYLAGPISGQMFKGAVDWRDEVAAALRLVDLCGLSPMRGKEALDSGQRIEGGYPDFPFAGPRAIITRDRYDVMNCDAVIMNLLPMGDRISIGTFIELGWADLCRTPVIMVRTPDCKSHHPMVDELVGFDVTNLSDAVHTVRTLLNAGA